jgi:V/A-type H+-transporting ATPase subunit B
LTGYITEGQIVLSARAAARGIYPPVDPLASLSRLMRDGAGPGRTAPEHLPLAAQLLASLARARQVHDLADLIGADTLSEIDRCYLNFEEEFENDLINQGRAENRTLEDILRRCGRVALTLPRSELTMLSDDLLALGRPGGAEQGWRT